MLITPIGEYWKGQGEIVKEIGMISDNMLKHISSKYTVRDIKFLAPNVALAVMHCADQVEQDFNHPDGSKGGTKGQTSESMMMHTLVKQNDVWKIVSTQITQVITPGSTMAPGTKTK